MEKYTVLIWNPGKASEIREKLQEASTDKDVDINTRSIAKSMASIMSFVDGLYMNTYQMIYFIEIVTGAKSRAPINLTESSTVQFYWEDGSEIYNTLEKIFDNEDLPIDTRCTARLFMGNKQHVGHSIWMDKPYMEKFIKIITFTI